MDMNKLYSFLIAVLIITAQERKIVAAIRAKFFGLLFINQFFDFLYNVDPTVLKVKIKKGDD